MLDFNIIHEIKNKIFLIRNKIVMLDSDLALIYGVEIKRLNEQVKRNLNRFPLEFMFQLNEFEFDSLRSQIATLKVDRGKHIKYFPYVFTEQGVAMLSAVLRSEFAINQSIKIMNAFVAMRHILHNNYFIDKIGVIEKQQIDFQIKTNKKFDELFEIVSNKKIEPKQGIFFDGQIFDVYEFISKIIKSASKSIILIDNFIDESILTFFSKRASGVSVTIYTKSISDELILDLKKYNSQYEKIHLIKFGKSHDRFIIIDNKIIYHFGASLKDLGKKWFAFSKFNVDEFKIIHELTKEN